MVAKRGMECKPILMSRSPTIVAAIWPPSAMDHSGTLLYYSGTPIILKNHSLNIGMLFAINYLSFRALILSAEPYVVRNGLWESLKWGGDKLGCRFRWRYLWRRMLWLVYPRASSSLRAVVGNNYLIMIHKCPNHKQISNSNFISSNLVKFIISTSF